MLLAVVPAPFILRAIHPDHVQTFVNWDDNINVYENPYVIGEKPLSEMWREWRDPGFYPLYYTLLRWQWIGHAWVYKLVSALIHGMSAVLVAMIAVRMGLGKWTSLVAGLIWGLHPIQVASVLWVSEQKNIVCLFLYLASIWVFINGLEARKPWPRFIACILLFIAALGVKAIAVTLPLVMLIWLLVHKPVGRQTRIGSAGVTIGVCLILAIAVGMLHSIREHIDLGPPIIDRIGLGARAVWFYLFKFLVPIDLIPMYPQWAGSEFLPIGLISVAGMLVVAVLMYRFRRKLSLWVWISSFYLAVNLALVVGIMWFPYLRFSWVSDHLMYLPSVGLAWLLAGFLGAVAARLKSPAALNAVGMLLIAVAMGRLTWIQGETWDSSGSLWSKALMRNPSCIPAYTNLASIFLEDGRAGGALDMAREGLKLAPEDPHLWHNFGAAQFQLGRNEEAIESLNRATSLGADLEQSFDLYLILGQSYARVGRHEEAVRALGKAIKYSRRSIDAAGAYRLRGELLQRLGQYDLAADAFEQALFLHEDDIVARMALANSLGKAGDIKASVYHLKALLQYRPDDQETLRSLARILSSSPDDDVRDGKLALELARRLRKLIGIQNPDIWVIEAMALAESGKFDEAVSLLRSARRRAESAGRPGLVEGIDRQLEACGGQRPIRMESLRQRRFPSRIENRSPQGPKK
jgi:tetratricopeptide (TPR) repeat protein